jgi:anti-sigma-K factor RskA
MSWKGWLSVWGAVIFDFALIVSQAEVRRAKAELAEARGLLARVSREMTEGVLWSQVVNAPRAHVALLGSASVGAPSGWITYDSASGRAVAMVRDAHPPDGRVFVLWAVAGTRYVRMGALDSAPSGNAALRVDRGRVVPDVTSFAISIEPASQATAAPTGPIVATAKSGG